MLKRWISVALAVVLTLGIAAAVLFQPAQATEITPMHVSEELVELVKDMEGFRAKPYWDYGQWTIGFGSACPEADRERYAADGIPPEEAHALMMNQLEKFEADVNAFMTRNEIQLNQHQFDALVSFVYNVGSSVLYNVDSNVIKAVLNGAEGNEFMFAIGQWSTAGGEFLLGLLRRRMVEAYMYLYGTYAPKPPESICYVKYDANGGSYEGRVQAYDSNLAAVPLSVPTRDGYIFTGWYTAASGGEKVTALDETTDGITLYAQWKEGTPATGTPTDPETGILVTVIGNSVSVRQTAGADTNIISHVYRGETLNIIGLTETDGTLWGYCSKGWINLEYTDYYEVTGTQRPDGTVPVQQVRAPIKVTVLSSSSVKVYNGPHTTYTELGTLSQGETVEVVETMNFCGLLWGRYEGGWIRLNQKILLHDENVLAHEFTANVTYSRLNVRSGPGTNYGIVEQIKDGAQVEVLAIVVVDGISWGRIVSGWIYLDSYTDYDPSQLSYYQNHSYSDWSITAQATCSQLGQMRRDCQHCDHYELQDIPKTEHSLSDWQITDEGSCVSLGKKTRTCQHCDYSETVSTELGQHQMGDWYVSVAATCVTEGQQQRNCKLCDHSENRTIGLGDHSYGDWTVVTAPSCETAGQEQRTCSNCSHVEERGVAATGHSYTDWVQTVAPGCETVGQEQRSCKNCSLVENREVAATGHSFGQWYEKVVPTAQTEGEARRDCANCDHYESKVLPVNPHTYGEWYVHTAATCSAAGEERRNCSHCEEYESRTIAALAHSYGEWTVSTAATCVTVGQEKRECTVCGHSETREGQLGDHSFDEWYTSVAGTCVTVGQEKRDCKLCDHSETRETVLGDHSFGDWTVITAPGCETTGQEQRNCKHCSHAQTRGIVATGHSVGQWSVTQAATCTAEGQEQRKCTACDYTESRTIEKLDHSYGDWSVTQTATCTAQGQEQRKCTVCGHTESRSTAMADHSYGDWYVVTAPTIDQEGQQARKCDNCDAVQTQSLSVLPSIEKVYATVTITSLNVRADASTSATRLGTLKKGQVVEITEQKTVDGNLWGKMEFGWILITDCADLNNQREAVVVDDGDKTYATVTFNGYLNIRPAAGDTGSNLGTVYTGVRLRVYETTVIGEVTWGRTAYGWLWLTGNTSVEVEPGVHNEHTYGQWYLIQAGTCLAASQDRRDCTGCDHFETREGQLGEHSYGEWQILVAPTYEQEGSRSRACAHCGDTQTETLPKLTTVEKVYATVTVSSLNVRAEASTSASKIGTLKKGLVVEILEQKTVDGNLWGRIEFGWILITDCAELKTVTESYEADNGDKTYATVTFNGYLNIRPAAGDTDSKLGTLYQGVRLRIYETTVIGEVTWGRTAYGWLWLTDNTTLETESGAHTEHTFGEWFVTQAATCTEEGQEQRKCTACDHVETRTVAMTQHSYGEWQILVAPTYEQEGSRSRACAHCGDTQTETLPKLTTVEKVYATVTISSLNVRAEASTSASKIGTLKKGLVVEILEQKTVDGNLWGRIEFGWILITDCAELKTVTESYEADNGDKTYATVTFNGYLNIRPAAGDTDSKLGTLYQGVRLRIYETTVIGEVTWGRTAYGWLWLTDNTTLETEADDTQQHSYGDWYVSVAPGCELAGQERRDCSHCDLFEVREIAALGHSLGQWYVSGAPTCENPGSQCRDCENCDYIESQPIDAMGHSFGQWYVTQEPTTTQVGQERRDCGTCGHYETREVAKLPVAVRVYGNYNGSTYLNIREGAGFSYTAIGKLQSGSRVEILEQKEVDGTLWGRIEAGWVCITGYIELEYVNVTYVSVTKLYATVTASGLTVYAESNSTATQLGTLNTGAVVQILQISTVDGMEWGRTETGWICMTGSVTLATVVEEVEEGSSIRMYATVTCKVLNIRADADAGSTYLGALKRGTVVEILEIKTVNGVIWGRTASGWICLSSNATLSTNES